MTVIMSPLRYPGSKQKALNKIKPFWEKVRNTVSEYREPFLGGASIFFNLDTFGKKVWLNDKNKNICTLFKVIRDYPEEICNKINSTQPSISLWTAIKNSEPTDDLEIAFRTLFLNRTNYSGILNASPIGGYRQKSEYEVGCRWNKEDLIERIRTCSMKLQRIEITSQDFLYVIIKPSLSNVFLIIDPPYYKKGNMLYDETMNEEDHIRLRDLLANTKQKFLLTYDNCEEVRRLYQEVKGVYFYETGWFYSTGTVSKTQRTFGKELFISNIDISDVTKLHIKESLG